MRNALLAGALACALSAYASVNSDLNRDFDEAMTHIAAGGGRVVLSGDRDQQLPVSNGAPFTLLQARSPLSLR